MLSTQLRQLEQEERKGLVLPCEKGNRLRSLKKNHMHLSCFVFNGKATEETRPNKPNLRSKTAVQNNCTTMSMLSRTHSSMLNSFVINDDKVQQHCFLKIYTTFSLELILWNLKELFSHLVQLK